MLNEIQHIVDDFSLNDYSNLETWVESLDSRILNVLERRLKELLQQWVNEFNNWDDMQNEAQLISCSTVHEIKVRDQILFLDPPLEEARSFWLLSLHNNIQSICG